MALLFEQESSCPLLKAIAHHAGVGAVGSTKGVIHIHVSQLPAQENTSFKYLNNINTFLFWRK